MSPATTITLPGELSPDAVRSILSDREGAGTAPPGASAAAFDPGPVMRPMSEVVRSYDLVPGEVRAVRALDETAVEAEEPAALAAARARLRRASEDLAGVSPDYLRRVMASASATRGCKCGSSIAKGYLSLSERPGEPPTLDCPVCGAVDFCLPAGDRDRKAALTARVGEARKAVDDALRAAVLARPNVVWVVVAAAPAVTAPA